MNLADLCVVAILALAFLKGFSRGIWNRLLGAAGSLAALFGAYMLTAPAVTYLDQKYSLVIQASNWASGLFVLLPVYSMPYSPGSFSLFANDSNSNGWLVPLRKLLEARFNAAYSVLGPGATWGQVMGLVLGQIVVAGFTFLLLYMVFSAVMRIITGTIAAREPATVVERLLGGLLEAGLSFIWLAVLVGALYPLLGLESLGNMRDLVSSSVSIKLLLGAYQTICGLALSRLRLPS